MNRKVKQALSVSILGLGIYYLSQKIPELSQLKQATFSQLATISLVILLTNLITGLKLKQMLLSQKVDLAPAEWFGLPNIRKSGNLLFFKSGTITNAYYLKARHDLSYSKFIIIFTGEKITSLYANILIGLLVSIFLYVSRGIDAYVVFFFLLLVGTLTFFLFFFSFKIRTFKNRFLRRVSRLLEIWNEFSNNRAVVFQLIVLEILVAYALSFRFFIAFEIFGYPVEFVDCLFITVTLALVGVVSLIPGNLGVREGAVGLTAKYLGFRFDYGVIVSVFDRILSTFWFGLLGVIFFHVLSLEKYERTPDVLAEPESRQTP